MIRRCHYSLSALVKYRPYIQKVGIMSDRLVMAEFEADCVRNLWRCRKVVKEAIEFYDIVEAYVKANKIKYQCRKALPFYAAIGNRSLHVLYPVCMTKIEFKDFYAAAYELTEKFETLDRKHIWAASQNGFITLRISRKDVETPPVKPVLLAYVDAKTVYGELRNKALLPLVKKVAKGKLNAVVCV